MDSIKRCKPTIDETFYGEIQLSMIGTTGWHNHQAYVHLCPVVYCYYDKQGRPLYVGKSKNFRKRHQSHMKSRKDTTVNKNSQAVDFILKDEYAYIGLFFCPDTFQMNLMEMFVINDKKPLYNKDLTDDAPSSVKTEAPTDNPWWKEFPEENMKMKKKKKDFSLPFPKEANILSGFYDFPVVLKEIIIDRKTLEEFALPTKIRERKKKSKEFKKQMEQSGITPADELKTIDEERKRKEIREMIKKHNEERDYYRNTVNNLDKMKKAMSSEEYKELLRKLAAHYGVETDI